jgi:hypothetical protein
MLLDQEDQADGKLVRELLEIMTEQEKNIFRAYLKTQAISEDIERVLD